MFRCLFLTFVLTLSPYATVQSAASEIASSDLCLLPVENGRPTEKDLNASWRMISDVKVIEGLALPIIYPLNRGGVWTINEANAFTPFGGAFPANRLHDHFASDPDMGAVIGVNPWEGVFLARQGGPRFEPLFKADGAPLRAPGLVAFVARLKGTIIADPNGLYLVDRQFQLTKLNADDRFAEGVEALIDLPDIKAVLISSGDRVLLWDEEGRTVRIATLEKWDGVRHAAVTSAGRIRLKTFWSEFEVDVPVKDGTGRFRPLEGAETIHPRGRLTTFPASPTIRATVGKRQYEIRDTKIFEVSPGEKIAVALPVDAVDQPLRIVYSPVLGRILIFSWDAIHVLDSTGHWTEVKGSRGRMSRGMNIIDLASEKGILYAAQDALYLLISSRSAAAVRCLH